MVSTYQCLCRGRCRAPAGSSRTRTLRATLHNNRLHIVTVHATPSGGSPGQAAMPASTPSVVTDQVVPEGHKGLHGFLYGEGGAERHESSSSYNFRQDEDDGSTVMDVGYYLDSRDGEKPLGVYAIYDPKDNLQYVGYSRNIALSIKSHLARVGEESCARCRVMVFANKAMATRSHLEEQAAAWIAASGTTPPGNGVEQHLWEGTPAPSAAASSAEEGEGPAIDLSAMSEAERAAYEEQKIKLRRAMGEDLYANADKESPQAAARRERLIKAVEGDNWSSVIEEQTAAALGKVAAPVVAAAGADSAAAAAGGASSSSSGGQVVSPFTQPGVHRQVGEAQHEALPMTVQSVDEVLNDVRPYLMADGGDVEVVGVEDGRVLLRLQGACSTCASSAATLKMGIERSLVAAFKDQLVEVVQVDAGSGPPAATVESVDLHLNLLRGAVANLGGAVEVESVGSGVVVLGYRGPAPIAKGLVAAIKDQFKDVREVVVRDLPVPGAAAGEEA